jgi:hypothetical protein
MSFRLSRCALLLCLLSGCADDDAQRAGAATQPSDADAATGESNIEPGMRDAGSAAERVMDAGSKAVRKPDTSQPKAAPQAAPSGEMTLAPGPTSPTAPRTSMNMDMHGLFSGNSCDA